MDRVPDDANPPDAPIPDATTIDATECAVPAPGEIGGTCSMNADCDSTPGAGDGFCVNATLQGPNRWPPEGFCSRPCAQPDDCGTGNVCADLFGSQVCLPGCCEGVGVGDKCSSGRLCADNLFGQSDLGVNACVPGEASALDGDPCQAFSQCNQKSICVRDGFESPNGVCYTFGCELGNDDSCAQGGDGLCIMSSDFVVPVCVDACDTASDCRVAEGFDCIAEPGVGMFCDHPNVGDPCGVDSDCGNAPPWTCLPDPQFAGGYCTLPPCVPDSISTCSITSVCHDPDDMAVGDEICVAMCDPLDPNACRAGYTCTPAGPMGENGCLPM